jgi:hypothetical protein
MLLRHSNVLILVKVGKDPQLLVVDVHDSQRSHMTPQGSHPRVERAWKERSSWSLLPRVFNSWYLNERWLLGILKLQGIRLMFGHPKHTRKIRGKMGKEGLWWWKKNQMTCWATAKFNVENFKGEKLQREMINWSQGAMNDWKIKG